MSLLDALFRYDALDKLFSDEARLQGMLDFEAALARAEASCGIVPESQAQIIAGRCRAEHFDLSAIAKDAALAGNLAIPLVRKLTELVAHEDKDAARFVHWGATSQDAIDTGCILQVRGAFDLIDQDLARLTGTLVTLAETHRAAPVVARTWMQQALPTTFGFIVAGWLDAVSRHRERLAEIKPRVLTLQFGGAVGTLAALGGRGPEVAKTLADDLRLSLASIPWHTNRDRIAEIATTLGLCTGTLGKIARDISLYSQTEIAELSEPVVEGRGGSSTMPHKHNPLTCAVVLAAGERIPPLVSTMLSSMIQEHQRGLGGWHAEWETLPDIVRLTGGAAHHLARMLPHLEVHTDRMQQNLQVTNGLIFAEALTFALAKHIGKSQARQLVESACQKAISEKRHLQAVIEADSSLNAYIPAAELPTFFDPAKYLGSSDVFIDNVLRVAAAQSAATPHST